MLCLIAVQLIHTLFYNKDMSQAHCVTIGKARLHQNTAGREKIKQIHLKSKLSL